MHEQKVDFLKRQVLLITQHERLVGGILLIQDIQILVITLHYKSLEVSLIKIFTLGKQMIVQQQDGIKL